MLKCGCPVDNGTFWYIDAVEEAIGLNDDDEKLIVSKNGNDYSEDAINALTEFQERFFDSVIIKKEYRFTRN